MRAIAILLSLTFLGCGPAESIQEPGTELRQGSDYYHLNYEEYTLDGCEYIVVSPGNSHFTWGSHKGNCKNPIHRCN